MARIYNVEKARKDQGTCRCGTAIKVGDPYKWTKNRFGPKLIRCGKCQFRPSELTQSKMSQVYAAQESISELLAEWDGDLDALKSDIESCIDDIENVKSEYEDAAEAMGDAGEQHRERAEELESWIDDLREIDGELEEFEGERDEENNPKDAKAFEEWKAGIVANVEDKFGNCPV